MANERLQRLFTIGAEINTLRSKITVATKYVGNTGTTGDAEEVVLAREVLRRDLERDYAEARELMPVVDELVSKFEERIKSIKESKKVNEGLARIEGLSGVTEGLARLQEAAGKDRAKISELENLIEALDDLLKDLSMKKEVISCPRCSSNGISYRISPSEMGFSLYRCHKCGNAWRTKQYSIHIDAPA